MATKSKLNRAVFVRLLSYWKTYKSLFFIAVLCTTILALLSPIRAVFLGQMVKNYITTDQDPNGLFFWTLIILSMLVAEGVFQFLSQYFANLFAQNIILNVRKKLMEHILTFRLQFFDKTPIGTFVTRLVSDLEAIVEVFSSGMMNIAGDLLSLIFVFSIMFYMNWKLSALIMIPIFLLILATRVFARVVRGTQVEEREQVFRLNNFVQERLTGMSLVQLFNRTEEEYVAFQGINKKHRQAHIDAVWAYSIFFPVVELLSSLAIAFIIVWTSLIAQGKSISQVEAMYGEVTTFVFLVHMVFRPIRQLADKFNILQRGTVRAERVFELLDKEDHIQQDGKNTHVNFDHDLYLEDLSFAYINEDWVLQDVNLKIKSGQTVAFVGATGAGKSTIVNLLGRFYEYQKGDIKIGDISITDIDLAYLRKNIAIVLQDVFLFSDSIINNITLNDPNISRDEVIEASKIVGAHDFITKLPNGYDYQVGERGGVLSSGQRQLIAFIRAYVYNPHILILDEATSSVDTESEELIQSATNKLTQGRTSIVIAHRLSTIQSADNIVVLDKGRIVESGSHEELLLKNGFYKKLYDMQFSEEIKHTK